ncbi:MAG TPA: MFS transporter [Gammaproteobacteria bacterium]|nr:MFS transporter [Gammaproteobacteria bacterium]
MTAQNEINISDVVDSGKLNAFLIAVFFLFGLFLIMDGFDVQAMGYVAPAVITEWKITNPQLLPAINAGLVGLFVGSMIFGMVGDRIGRRRVLLIATAAFGVCTLLCSLATSVWQLAGIRFLAGLGLGAILPNATALVGEFSPKRIRVASMMIVTNGFTVGAMLGGFLASWLIPRSGWQAVFIVGGIVPLALLLPMYLWLPESLQFLALRRNDHREIAKWLTRINPAAVIDASTRFVVREERSVGVPVLRLFGDGRAAGTALIWIANFLNILNAYFVASWLPTVVRDAGYSISTGTLVGASVQTGGTIGTIVIALLFRRIGFIPVLTACFALEAVSLALIGEPSLSLPLLFLVAFTAGWGIFAGQPTLNALSATYYPTDLRSTGIGAALGVGRLGSIVGPTVGAVLMAQQWSREDLFHAAAVPAVVATLSVLAMSLVMATSSNAQGSAVGVRR